MPPAVRRIATSDLPVEITALSLVQVIGGEMLLRGESGTHRLLAGELLSVRSGPGVVLDTRRSGEALVFHADPSWASLVRTLFEAPGQPGAAAPLARERAGSGVAQRAGRVLVASHLDLGQGSPPSTDLRRICPASAGRFVELVAIAEDMAGSLVDPREPAGARIRSRRASLVRTLEDLDASALDGFSLGVLAGRLGVSLRQASRLVRQELGTSLPAYLSALRIERAKKLLVRSDDSITEVALETGWRSLSHFNAVFRRHVGMTPSAFRAYETARHACAAHDDA